MNIDPTVIYGAFTALTAAVVALWANQMRDHKRCQRNVSMLIDHTVAQQRDIDRLMEDRKSRRLPEFELHSQQTEFYRRKCSDDADEIDSI